MLTETKKKIVILFLLAVSLIGIYYFLVADIMKKNQDIYTMLQNINNAKVKESEFVYLNENLSLAKDKIEKLHDFILKTDGEVDFIKVIEDLALSSNVKSEIKSAQTEQISDKESSIAENFRIGIDAVGTWSDDIYFLTLIENLPFQVTINNVSFEKISDYEIKGEKVPQWLLRIDFSIIKQK
ncbi:MAG: hypothetical protein WCC74_02200 [Minisyncoccia bacterium]